MNELPTIAENGEAFALLEALAKHAGPLEATFQRVMERQAGQSPHTHPPREIESQTHLRYRSLIEKLPAVTFMASLDDRVQELYVSPQIESLLGFTQEEWLDNPILWYRQLHPDDRERWVEQFAQTCSTGAHFRSEYRLFARDGRIVWVQGECQIIRDEGGYPLFLQGIAFDITHLKNAAKAEEERRTALAASEAKSEFLARMSHEIRTPLNGVVGMIDLLSATGMTDIQKRYTQLARDSAGALLLVINDILDFSKIEAGKVEIESIEFGLHALIEDLSELLAPLAAKKKLALASVIRSDVPRLAIGDPNRIRQVLTNLVNNALKFTAQGSVSVRALLESKTPQGFVVRIEVQDTGIGIPADRLDRLFKSFSQVDTSTTRKYGGTGLGLAISKKLVELMGGDIGIRSKEGQGTTFWFTLALRTAETDPSAATENQISCRIAESLANVRVLAVEPDPTYRKILAEQLDGRLSSQVVADTPQALTAIRQAGKEGKPFAVVFISYATPDRESMIQVVQGDPSLKQTSFIALTDPDDPAEPEVIKKAGFAARLSRPLTQSRIIDTVASMTVRPSKAKSATPPAAPSAVVDVLKGLHILVAEDNEMNQFVTQEILKRAGCTSEIVADGALAVQAASRRRYDAVLMDCQMPGTDGLEATRRIRQTEAAAASPRQLIIALTAEAIQGDREKCLAAGMDGYVTKPINAQELFSTLRALIQPAQPPIGDSPTAAPLPNSDLPIDVTALLARCMQDAQFAMTTLQKFQQRAANDVDRLRQGVDAGNADQVMRLAHNLKAVAAHVAANPMRKIAFEIEQAGARADLKFVSQQLARLDEEAKRCAAFIPIALQQIEHSQTSANTPSSKK